MPTKKGFTLIELLTVISIIALLATIVSTGIANARAKANDARIKSQMNEVFKAGILYYADNETYGFTRDLDNFEGFPGECNVPARIAGSFFENLGILITENYTYGNVWCVANDTVFAFSAALYDPSPSPDTYWCVDSNGYSGLVGDPSTLPGTCI